MRGNTYVDHMYDLLTEFVNEGLLRDGEAIIYAGEGVFAGLREQARYDETTDPSTTGVPQPTEPPKFKLEKGDPEKPPRGNVNYDPTQLRIFGDSLIIRDPTTDRYRVAAIATGPVSKLGGGSEFSHCLETSEAIREFHLVPEEQAAVDETCSTCEETIGDEEVWVEGTDGELYCAIDCMNEALRGGV